MLHLLLSICVGALSKTVHYAGSVQAFGARPHALWEPQQWVMSLTGQLVECSLPTSHFWVDSAHLESQQIVKSTWNQVLLPNGKPKKPSQAKWSQVGISGTETLLFHLGLGRLKQIIRKVAKMFSQQCLLYSIGWIKTHCIAGIGLTSFAKRQRWLS